MVLTKLGRLTVEESFSGGAIESMQFVAASSFIAPCIVAVTTFRGELALNFCYQRPTLSPAFAERVVARTRTALEHLANAQA
jgi:hypothetical protein